MKNFIKNLLNDLLTLKTIRNKKRDRKKNLFSARFNYFFLNFIYRNKLTKDCSFNSLKENNVNIDNVTLISSSIIKTIEKKEKKILIN